MKEDLKAPLSVPALLYGSDCRPPRSSSATTHREQAFGKHPERCRVEAPNESGALHDEWDKCLVTMRALLSRMDAEHRISRRNALPRGIAMELFSLGPRQPVRASHTVCSGFLPAATSSSRKLRPSSSLPSGEEILRATTASKVPEDEKPRPEVQASLRVERPVLTGPGGCNGTSAKGSITSLDPTRAIQPHRPSNARGRQGRPGPVRRLSTNGRSCSRRHTIGSSPTVAANPQDSDPHGDRAQEAGGESAPLSQNVSPGAASAGKMSTLCASSSLVIPGAPQTSQSCAQEVS